MERIPSPGEFYRHYTNRIYQIVTIATHSETNEKMVIFQALYGDFTVYASPLAQFISEVDHKKYPRVKQCHWFERVEKGRWADQDADGQARPTKQGAELHDQTTKQGAELHGQTTEQGAELHGQITEQGRDGGAQVTGISGQAALGADKELPAQTTAGEKMKESRSVGIGARPRTKSPADSKRAFRQDEEEAEGTESVYSQRRRRQLAEREQRREMFRRPARTVSATAELQANPNLLKFLEADTYEEKYQVLNEIQDDITDRLIDDIAVVLDVVIPEGDLNSRYYQLKNIILTRQKYEISRYRS